MKKYIGIFALFFCAAAVAQSQTQLEAAAMKGDYQAQRNLAYSFAQPMKGEKEDKIAACSWYLVVVKSGNKKVDSGDTGNAEVYCGKLTSVEQAAADAKSAALVRKIYNRRATF